MNNATLNLEAHENGVTVRLEVCELTALERLGLIGASVRAAFSGRARVSIPHARAFVRGENRGAKARLRGLPMPVR